MEREGRYAKSGLNGRQICWVCAEGLFGIILIVGGFCFTFFFSYGSLFGNFFWDVFGNFGIFWLLSLWCAREVESLHRTQVAK